MSDAFREAQRLGIRVTIEGTEGARILPELEMSADDRVVVKKRYSAFFRTDLDDTLAALKPSILILAGINTHACIRTTAIDAYQRDYALILASECIGSYDIEHHNVTLRYLNGKMGVLLTNTEISYLLSREDLSPQSGK